MLPFCYQCSDNAPCSEVVDSACVIYHFSTPTYTPPSTQLINMGLPNGSNAQTIFDTIDKLLGTSSLRPFVLGNTDSIDLEFQGSFLPFTLLANVNISSASGNTLIINSDGLYASSSSLQSYKVKVDANSFPGYLSDVVFGGTDGCVNIDIDDVDGLLLIQPSLNIQCLLNSIPSSGITSLICNADPTDIAEMSYCLLSYGLGVSNTNSIDLSVDCIQGEGCIITANVNISANEGNTLVIESDGLYSSGGIAQANNGLSISGGFVQLGGQLIEDTTINNAGAQLNFTNVPYISIGSSASISNQTTLFVTDSGSGNTNIDVLSTMQIRNLSNTGGYVANNSFLQIVGPTFDHTLDTFQTALGGQLWWNATGDQTLSSASSDCYAGIYGITIQAGTGTVTNNIISGGFFGMFAANSADVDSGAGIKIFGVGQAPEAFGSAYTGTITNFYGLYIDDITESPNGSKITNKYAIYQLGTDDLVQFNGPVTSTNALNNITGSDERVKENITDFSSDLNALDSIKLHRFNYNYDKHKTPMIGVVAQELEKIIPELVVSKYLKVPGGKEINDFKFVNTGNLLFMMLGAIQQLSAQNKTLNDRIFELEAKLK